MLTVTFPKGHRPRVRTMILDTPVDITSGIVECIHCGQNKAISEKTIRRIAESIEQFAYDHECGKIANTLTKQLLLKAIREVHDVNILDKAETLVDVHKEE